MCLVTILWDKESSLNPLMGLNCWFRTLILLLLVSWRNPSSEKGNSFYWPTENCSLRFGGNAKLSSLPVLSLWTAAKSSCASSYMHVFSNSRCNYANCHSKKAFSPSKDLETFIIASYKIPWSMWSVLRYTRLLVWTFFVTLPNGTDWLFSVAWRLAQTRSHFRVQLLHQQRKNFKFQLISLLDLYYSREIDVISLKRQLDYKESLS